MSETTKRWRAQPCSIVPMKLRELVRRSAVLSYFVLDCLNLYRSTVLDIEKHWALEASDIERLGLRSAPSWVTNLIGANACAEKFGDLSDIPGFYLCDGLWWADLDESFARRGIILPIRDPQRPFLITGLKVFPHVNARPFALRVRSERTQAA